MWVRSLGRENPLEGNMTTHFNILAREIPWTEEPGGLQSIGSQRVGHDRANSLSLFSRSLGQKLGKFSSVQLLSRVQLFVNLVLNLDSNIYEMCDPQQVIT